MKSFVWFLVGLLVGAAGIWFYNATVVTSRITQEAKLEVAQKAEQEKRVQEVFVSGIIAEIAADGRSMKLDTLIEDASENRIFYTIQLDAATRYIRGGSEVPQTITLADFKVGDQITVTSNAAIANQPTIYAQEILLF